MWMGCDVEEGNLLGKVWPFKTGRKRDRHSCFCWGCSPVWSTFRERVAEVMLLKFLETPIKHTVLQGIRFSRRCSEPQLHRTWVPLGIWQWEGT